MAPEWHAFAGGGPQRFTLYKICVIASLCTSGNERRLVQVFEQPRALPWYNEFNEAMAILARLPTASRRLILLQTLRDMSFLATGPAHGRRGSGNTSRCLSSSPAGRVKTGLALIVGGK